MLLNLTVVYGLRAMAVLAGLVAGESLNAKDLAARTGVPQQYLSKVMRKLVVARLVRSQRGHGGGFSLAQPAARITMAAALQALDVQIDGGCAFGYAACNEAQPCALHPLWSRLRQGLDTWANSCTFGDVAGKPRGGRALG
ncbi:MAG: Rrf2 family transcriptional regulator [Planctomycetes bacterium]|nr:Rrf2 family transcriptional regulator [Planctomycetota bacterium]